MRSRLRTRLAAALLGAGCTIVSASPGTAATEPPSSGWNDWTCRPSTAHPHPVVLLHGLTSNGHDNWDYIAPRLVADGYCVFSLTYGQAAPHCGGGGTGPVVDSAEEIVGFMDRVRAATGTARVDLVGHSEGAFLALYIPKVLGRADDVHTIVALGIELGGTASGGIMEPVDLLGARPPLEDLGASMGCQAYPDLAPGSAVRQRLADGPIAQPGVAYTVINTRYDEFSLVLTPTDQRLANEPGIDFMYVQDVCPLDPVGHIGMASDPSVYGLIANALDPPNAGPVTCGIGLPL
jgi:pimeloyl-ACP methyl ester carboxylesterase